MTSTNGHGPKRAILYARVSTDEQARSGYSLAQQIEALRAYAAREGYEVLQEVSDPGQSGASLERPGMDRVRDLVASGGVSVVLAQDRDRFAREPAYHYLLRREFQEHGTKIRALNDKGDDSPEGELTDGILDQLAKYERAKTAERSRRGKLRKAREGKVIAIHTPNYGFRYNATRDGYEVDEEAMRVVRRDPLLREILAQDVKARGGKGRDLTRRMLYLPALIVAGVLLACAAAVLALSEKAEATFPGKNGRIAYSAFDFDTGVDDRIYTIKAGGGHKTQLTRGYQPSYSPNGKRIAYTRTTYRRVTPTVSADPIDEIFTVNVGGGAKTKVTIGSDPSFSPDGIRIVYYAYDETSSKRLPDTEIYTINVNGGDKTQLTHNNKDEFTPDYSPDGKRIVYAGLEGLERNDAESDIYTIKASGGGKTQVTNNDNVDDLHPTYSPDGKKIAYTRIISRDAGPPISDIYTINASGGGGKIRVTHTNTLFEIGPSWGSRP